MRDTLLQDLMLAVLHWDLKNREGTRLQQVESERRLSVLAQELRAHGYDVKWKQ